MTKLVRNHTDLEVYKRAFEAAMRIFEVTRSFPKEETYSLTDHIRRSSRSVCSNLAKGWRKRQYEKAFVSKLSDCESEAAETQVWLAFAAKCGYLERTQAADLYRSYEAISSTLVGMRHHTDQWILPS